MLFRGIQSICLVFTALMSGCAISAGPENNLLDGRHSKHSSIPSWNIATQAVISKYGPVAEHRILPYFNEAGVSYPPKHVALLAFKNERKVELWARNQASWHFIRQYPLTAFSGKLGPKLREHDGQIPEGIYRIGFLSPYSSWHLSMKLDYPNQFDLQHAKQDGRRSLGGDIFIHGRSSSVGCLAVGDAAIEELFVLVAKTGTHAAKVIIAPNDMRTQPSLAPSQPRWVPELAHRISRELVPFQLKPQAV